jgi:plasmid stabilization system protein ParE
MGQTEGVVKKQATAKDYERVTALKDSPGGGLAAIRARNGVTNDPMPVPSPRPAPQPAAPSTRRPPVTTPTFHRDSLTEMIEKAKQLPTKSIASAARRVEDAIQRLRDVIADDDGKRAARREVERLEQQLADARAKLRGRAGAPRARGAVIGEFPRTKGCGRVCTSGPGRSAHERHCTGQAA